jgi:hypothetical protein
MVPEPQPEIRNRNACAPKGGLGGILLNLAGLGCLIGGAIGIIQAVEMEQAGEGVLCLLASIAATSLVCYLFFQNRQT